MRNSQSLLAGDPVERSRKSGKISAIVRSRAAHVEKKPPQSFYSCSIEWMKVASGLFFYNISNEEQKSKSQRLHKYIQNLRAVRTFNYSSITPRDEFKRNRILVRAQTKAITEVYPTQSIQSSSCSLCAKTKLSSSSTPMTSSHFRHAVYIHHPKVLSLHRRPISIFYFRACTYAAHAEKHH